MAARWARGPDLPRLVRFPCGPSAPGRSEARTCVRRASPVQRTVPPSRDDSAPFHHRHRRPRCRRRSHRLRGGLLPCARRYRNGARRPRRPQRRGLGRQRRQPAYDARLPVLQERGSALGSRPRNPDPDAARRGRSLAGTQDRTRHGYRTEARRRAHGRRNRRRAAPARAQGDDGTPLRPGHPCRHRRRSVEARSLCFGSRGRCRVLPPGRKGESSAGDTRACPRRKRGRGPDAVANHGRIDRCGEPRVRGANRPRG